MTNICTSQCNELNCGADHQTPVRHATQGADHQTPVRHATQAMSTSAQ